MLGAVGMVAMACGTDGSGMLLLTTYRIGEARTPGEGLRLGTVRYLPRGVPKSAWAERDFFDVWLPQLAPSAELFRTFRAATDAERSWPAFARRYRKEMAATEPRQTIRLLALAAARTPIAVGCYCGTERCHRFVLEGLIRDAAAAPAF